MNYKTLSSPIRITIWDSQQNPFFIENQVVMRICSKNRKSFGRMRVPYFYGYLWLFITIFYPFSTVLFYRKSMFLEGFSTKNLFYWGLEPVVYVTESIFYQILPKFKKRYEVPYYKICV